MRIIVLFIFAMENSRFTINASDTDRKDRVDPQRVCDQSV